MARGTGVDFTFKDLMLIGCLFFILPTICLCVVIVTPIIGTILFLTRDPDEEGRVTFFYISWALVGVAIVGSFIFCCVNEYIRKRNADNLMEEFRLMNEAAAANDANASIESDITDFGDLAIADAARPQVAANLAANVGVDAEAFLNNETIRQDLAADEDHFLPYVATRARLWGLFFDQVFTLGSRYIAMGVVPPKDIAEVAPWVALGIPAAVVADLALRSIRDNNVGGLTLQNGTRISDRFRPRVGAGTELWEPQMRLQASVAVADLTGEEAEYFVALCFFCGQPLMAARVRPETLDRAGVRHSRLMRLTVLALQVARDITALQGFTDHFVATVTGLALLENEYQGTGDGDDMSTTTVTSSGSGHHL